MLKFTVRAKDLLYALMPSKFEQAAKTAIRAVTVYLKGKVAVYPPAARAHRPQPFKTDKSRRFFFAALREGRIEVPYRRGMSPGSEAHSISWSVKYRDAGFTGVIGSDTTYGPLLQDKARQTRYHQETGWKTTQQVADEEEEDVLRQIDRIIANMMGF